MLSPRSHVISTLRRFFARQAQELRIALADGARLREELRAIAELAQQHEEARRLLRLFLGLHTYSFGLQLHSWVMYKVEFVRLG